MSQVRFSSDVVVDLIKHSASDMDVAMSAWVSTKGENSNVDVTNIDDTKVAGLIGYLMRERHGCYDSNTDVLTSDGWKNWTDIDGSEDFLTLNIKSEEIEYQKASHLVCKDYSGPMLHFQMAQVDQLVTPDHNIMAQVRQSSTKWNIPALIPASSLLERSGRFLMGTGNWHSGSIHAPDMAALVGFIVADGSATGTSIEFNLRKQRKIEWLTSRHEVSVDKKGTIRIINASEELRYWAKNTYTESKDRCFPRELIANADIDTAKALLDGYIQGDGSISRTGKITATTVSRQIVDDLQELAAKCGMAATETAPSIDRSSSFGNRPLYKITIYRNRNLRPRIGWTHEARKRQVKIVQYEGKIHCVTVPNGTLYVRRNGKPMWSGNSPFEHSYFTFYVKAPIFVWREHMRHRIASYNEESGRYKVLEPEFYLPARERRLVQVGKTGAYTFEDGTSNQHAVMLAAMRSSCKDAYCAYEFMLENGIAKEVARMTLPVSIYSSAYVTMNARALMNFLSLRKHADDSHFPSYPQREIEMVAEKYESIFSELMPVTYAAFMRNGRVAP